MQDEIQLGERIASWRSHRDLTQAELAEMLELTPAAIGYWETNETTPTQTNLQRLVEALELTMPQFWGRVPARKERRKGRSS